MGMDVYGKKPSSECGRYFRNNVWWWHPLWDYVYSQCGDIITEAEFEAGHTNEGRLINAKKAKEIAARLNGLCKNGSVANYENAYRLELNALPDELCEHCHGTGTRTDMTVPNGCNGCNGKGKVRPWETNYPFSEENVAEFAKFCAKSGGFRIC